MKTKLEHFIHSAGFTSCLASIASILMGLLVGLVLLYAFNAPFALYGFKQILTAGFSALDKLAKVLYQAAPLIMTGLSVGFAFKTGLFNIGAPGQYTIGAFFALTAAIQFQQPWYIAMVAGMICGAI